MNKIIMNKVHNSNMIGFSVMIVQNHYNKNNNILFVINVDNICYVNNVMN